ncbi:MAG: aldose 1-epimerase family protein [Clostridiales bacterium]|nr:aldose 1-epimerase family protein [Clostridiales bacterium]
MIYTIENDVFSVKIKDMGAELTSFVRKSDGVEYLWQGNPDIWYGQSPILFPFIGQLIEDKFRYNGREYSVPKHGFVRRRPFNAVSVTGSNAVFSICSNEETLKMYPFEFELTVCYELTETGLKTKLTVVNKTDGEMYFSLGAHPGFNCAIGDSIIFEKNETLNTERIDSSNLIIDEVFPVLDDSNRITLEPDTFTNDALILSGLKSTYLTVDGAVSGHRVRFTFGDCPFLGIWAKPNAPYVCIEPWYGVNDSHEKKDDISQKRGIERLDKGETFSFSWTAEIL